MLNFLPLKNKKQIVSEYALRVLSFFLLFVFVSSLILFAFFAPSFFFVKYKNDTVDNQLVLSKQKNISKREDPDVFIKNINQLSVVLSDNNISDSINSNIIDKITSLKNKDIKILSINIILENSSGDRKVSLGGIANTRDGLTLFSNDIKIDGFFDSVMFPVSYFIKSTNSEFSATLIYKNK